MKHRGKLYIDKNGILRMVMSEYPNNIVRGIDISNMSIDGIYINDNLESTFTGYSNLNDRRNKVLWK